jgi:hypothetical protein
MSLLFFFAILVILGGCQNPSRVQAPLELDSRQMSLGKAPAARFEISIDGVPRSHRDRKEFAIEAAARLMLKFPHGLVAVKDLASGKAVAVDQKLRLV